MPPRPTSRSSRYPGTVWARLFIRRRHSGHSRPSSGCGALVGEAAGTSTHAAPQTRQRLGAGAGAAAPGTEGGTVAGDRESGVVATLGAVVAGCGGAAGARGVTLARGGGGVGWRGGGLPGPSRRGLGGGSPQE